MAKQEDKRIALTPGTVLDGKYTIQSEVGRGSFGITYLAMNTKLGNQLWAVKEIHREPGNETKLRKAIEEARVMMALDHPAIPRIVDILEREKAAYIIMDFVSGLDLHKRLKQNGPIPQETVIDWGLQLCDVFSYLHKQNPPIIYHDLKPSNVILKEEDGRSMLKLLDFGEARKLINGDAPGGGKTPHYAAPEQLQRGGRTDQRSDIYTLGTTMYRLLTGQFVPNFPEEVGSVRARFPELNISKGMDRIIRQCTRPDPEKRFQSMDEVAAALSNVQLWDDDYLRRQKRKIGTVITSAVLSVAMLAAGFGLQAAAKAQDSKNYDALVNVSFDMNNAVESYREAIELDGTNTVAYMRLVEYYKSKATQDDHAFGEEESSTLYNAYNMFKSSFDMKDPNIVELNYQIGRLYMSYYDGSDRERINKAQQFFELVVDNADPAFKNRAIANSYNILCSFYKSFVLDVNAVYEPTEEELAELTAAINNCIDDMQKYNDNDAAYTRLTMYRLIINLIGDTSESFAAKGVALDDINALLDNIEEAINDEAITRSTIKNFRAEVLDLLENVRQTVAANYESQKRGNV